MSRLESVNKYKKSDVELTFQVCNLFPVHSGHVGKVQLPPHSITFDTFKKTFYPHLYIVEEENQSDEEKEAMKKK